MSHFDGSRDGGDDGGDDKKLLFGYPYVYLCGAGMIGCAMLSIVVKHPFLLYTMHLGIQMRLTCCAMIYRKVCRFAANYNFSMPFSSFIFITGAAEIQIGHDRRIQRQSDQFDVKRFGHF